jgi:NADPH-dependent 2,4-dienoyl-CoA reductase/sulfur reductase-like enzyme
MPAQEKAFVLQPYCRNGRGGFGLARLAAHGQRGGMTQTPAPAMPAADVIIVGSGAAGLTAALALAARLKVLVPGRDRRRARCGRHF